MHALLVGKSLVGWSPTRLQEAWQAPKVVGGARAIGTPAVAAAAVIATTVVASGGGGAPKKATGGGGGATKRAKTANKELLGMIQ